MAISGLNITLLAYIIVLLLGIARIERKVRFVLSIGLVCAYAAMVGAEAPVTRAALMSMIFLAAFVIEREQDMLNTFGFAALVMTLVEPRQVFDTGFQLSFGCVLSIVLIAPMFLTPFVEDGVKTRRPVLWWCGEMLAVSFAAWAGSAGIMAYTFGNLTPIGLLANLPVVPLATLVTALGAGLVLTAFAFSPLAWLFAASLKATLNLLVFTAWAFSQVPGGYWPLAEVPGWVVAGYYFLLFLGLWMIRTLRVKV